MENLLKQAIMLMFLAVVSCGQQPLIPRPKPPPDPDSGEPCARACLRLEQLECPEAKPEEGQDGIAGTEDDVPCLEWMCAADYLDYEAIAHASTCKEALTD